MTPDVNVLVAAARPDHVHHSAARAWLATMEDGRGQTLLLLPMVIASFLRLVIHSSVFAHPSRPDEAVAFIDQFAMAPGARIAQLGTEWPTIRSMCLAATRLKPNDVADIWIAAAVREHGEHLVTFDTGFRRLLKRSELTILA